MTDFCETLHAYVDGELDEPAHSAFETHLASCEDCAAELPRLLALMTALDRAAEASAQARRLVVIDGGSEAALDRSRSPSRRSRRPLWIAGGATAALAAAAALLLFVGLPRQPAPQAVSLAAELGPTRAIQARLSYPGTGGHRPFDVARGARGGEPISTESRVRLERAQDWHGLAVASLLAGERERAAQLFAQVPPSPHADSDRAALELLDGSQPALERALDDVDRALAALPGDPAALWNRALVLEALNLPAAAAREFERVAALGEAGWADEARRRAETLRRSVTQRRLRWRQAYEAGQKMIEDGTPVPEGLAAVTGTTTVMLYDAVRAAPSKERALALLPLAGVLDRAYRTDRLTRYVQRVAAADFRVRKPLADSYRDLALKRLAPGGVEPFLAKLARTPGVDDIRMGALVKAQAVGANLDEYRRLATASQDPWFAAIAMAEAARAEIARGDVVAGERDLREAIAFAQRERVGYRALLITDQLIVLHKDARYLSRVAAETQAQFRDAIAAGEWIIETNALRELSSVNQGRYANGQVRAYLTELLERSEPSTAEGPLQFDELYDCATRQYAYQSLAVTALLQLDPEGARGYVAKVPECATDPTNKAAIAYRGVMISAELYHLGHREEDARLARDGIATMRAAANPGNGLLAMARHIEGSLAIEQDREAGRRALRESIAAAADPTDILGVQARAFSFSLLALDAGGAGEFADVIGVLADAVEVPRPERCALAVAVQGQRSVVAFVDASGQSGGEFVANRKTSEVDASTLVPASVAERLRPCDRVTVLARAPVLGTARLLPPDLAWSYALKRSSPALHAAAPARRLVVANPVIPADLNLPPLGPFPDEAPGDGLTILRGADATPTRVLLEMRDASIIEFHTHGIIANDVSEASYLVLSPELDRQYAMTAADVEPNKLTASPLVILGACHAATSSRSLEGGMGLAEAFLRAGARAVVASPDAIQDLSARAFFGAVRDQVMHGADPAIAVRDQRQRSLAATQNNSWIGSVVVFE
ncbi:MAG TPA: CHAT domain-containing protein [Kofleriaceae bacterium]